MLRGRRLRFSLERGRGRNLSKLRGRARRDEDAAMHLPANEARVRVKVRFGFQEE